ncbi:MAG: PDZ domain-containing protein [Candidatus Acidiferrales bacterium]
MKTSFRSSHAVVVILVLFAALACPRPASAVVKYRISLAHADQHLFRVTMDIQNPVVGTRVALPVWNALYQVRDFATRLDDVHLDPAFPLRQLDKQTWQIGDLDAPRAGNTPDDYVLHYTIRWDDPGPFNSQLDAHHAFINFAELLMYVPDRRPEPVIVSFDEVPSGWRLAAQLAAGPEPNSFSAASYDALVDAPVEAGDFHSFSFEESGANFRVVLDGSDRDQSELQHNLQRIVAYEIRLMSGAPFTGYTFFFHIGGFSVVGGGGMEHANCTAISAANIDNATSIAAHEFFHAWNVKRIRPRSLEPVDYAREQDSPSLWFAEGVTSAYASFTLVRTGLWSRQRFYADLLQQINELQARPARSWQSVEASSLSAWLEKYDDYLAPSRSISYYNKGQLIGLLLDLDIRDATDNQKSLDDVLRLLNDRFARQNKFYDDTRDLRAAVEAVSGKDFSDFFRRYVSGADELPYSDFLALAGLDLKVQQQSAPDLGFWIGHAPGVKEASVAAVDPGGPAERAGLLPGDQLVSLDGSSVPRDLMRWLRDRQPGEIVALHVRRDGKYLDISFPLVARIENQYALDETSHPSPRQLRIREALLRGTDGAASH